MIGLATVKADTLPVGPAVEMGWRLAHEAWGGGYATEGRQGGPGLGLRQSGRPRDHRIHRPPRDLASQAVMRRIGMTRTRPGFRPSEVGGGPSPAAGMRGLWSTPMRLETPSGWSPAPRVARRRPRSAGGDERRSGDPSMAGRGAFTRDGVQRLYGPRLRRLRRGWGWGGSPSSGKPDGVFLGAACGLMPSYPNVPLPPYIDMGWRHATAPRWGHGYATEASHGGDGRRVRGAWTYPRSPPSPRARSICAPRR